MYLFFFKLFSQLDCCRILSKVSCVKQQLPVKNSSVYTSIPNSLTIPSPNTPPPRNNKFILKACESISIP